MAIDESEDVSFTAQEFLEYLFGITGNHQLQHDIAKIFVRFLSKYMKTEVTNDLNFLDVL